MHRSQLQGGNQGGRDPWLLCDEPRLKMGQAWVGTREGEEAEEPFPIPTHPCS